jgi:hypothetical protein
MYFSRIISRKEMNSFKTSNSRRISSLDGKKSYMMKMMKIDE